MARHGGSCDRLSRVCAAQRDGDRGGDGGNGQRAGSGEAVCSDGHELPSRWLDSAHHLSVCFAVSRSKVVAIGLLEQAAAVGLHGDQVAEELMIFVTLLDR